MNPNKKMLYVEEANKIEKEIKEGGHGNPGERFMPTRELSKVRGVSLVTANRIMTELRRKKMIELCGKKFYLTHGRVTGKSPFGKLKSNDNKIIGLHITNMDSQFFASLARCVEASAKLQGYRVITTSSLYNHEDEKEILNMFCDIGVSGILSCPGISNNTFSLYENYILPYVLLGRKPEGSHGECVLINNYPAARTMASHFIKKGYKKFAYVGLEELDRKQDSRFAGFASGLKQEGYMLNKQDIVSVNVNNAGNTSKNIERFLRRINEPTGVFCFHDLLAVSVLKSCNKLKIKIPKKIAIAGFDDLPIASSTIPPLTTVRYCIEEMAETAVRLLLNQIRTEKETNTNHYIEPSVKIRGSTSNIRIKTRDDIKMYDILYKMAER